MAAELYPTCVHTKRQKPDMMINKELAEAIGRDYHTLPAFEKTLFEHSYIKYYSLKNNEYLNCRWREYVKRFEERVIAPFQFVDRRDFHFHNGYIRLLPSESFHKKTDFRLTMKPGPGVDFVGERPIPDEMVMKRGEKLSTRPQPLKRKGKNVAGQVGLKRV